MPTKGYRTDNPKYATVHIWLKLDRGDPKDSKCHFCGGAATEWVCFRNKTEKEFRQRWVRYSKNLEDYVPGCHSCNAKLDKPAQETCRRGHNDWVENKNQTHKKRTCRTCRDNRVNRRRGKAN